MEPVFSISIDSLLLSSEGKKKEGVAVRSILVRDLPNSLSPEQSKEALRQLFSGAVRNVNNQQVNAGDSRRNQCSAVLVPARQGALAQSSWQAKRLAPKQGPGDVAQRKLNLSSHQHRHLLQQLPYSVSNIRVASDGRGGSIYAVVDFTHELLASLALQLLGETATLPNISAQVRLSLHETLSTPMVVDQYHLYVSGLPPGATAAHVEDIITSSTGIAPTRAKVSAVAGLPSRKGMQEYAFLRYADEESAEEALKKLMEASVSLNLIVRRVHKHRNRGNRVEPLTHSANCSIFIANLPPLTNSEELREICSYFHVVRSAEVHPTKNFGFVRLASHEAALAAISHLHGMQLHGRTLACAWSSRTMPVNEEETLDDSWEREEEAYAIMSAQCMDYEAEPQHPNPALGPAVDTPAMSSRGLAKRSATEAISDAFWLSILAENGPVNMIEFCSRMKRRQRELQLWHEQEWEEDTDSTRVFHAQAS